MTADPTHTDPPWRYARLHLRFGWWSLLVFLTLGTVLEALYGLKVGWYLDEEMATRKLLWRLAHAHGTLLSVVHVVFALTVSRLPRWNGITRTIASRCLTSAALLLPGGFFLGGFFFYEDDPGLGIFLVPPGGALLFIAVLLTARGARLLGDGDS